MVVVGVTVHGHGGGHGGDGLRHSGRLRNCCVIV